MNIKTKLFYCSFVFVCAWVIGQVFKANHMQNLVYSLCMTIACGIYYGAHKDIIKVIKGEYDENSNDDINRHIK